MNKTIHFMKIYLLIATIAGLFGAVIGYGALAYAILEYTILSGDEYITASNQKRELDNCKQPQYLPDGKTQEKTDEEIQKCVQEATERLMVSRSTNMKTTVLKGGVWGTIFLILFITHYPKFRKEQE